MRLGGFEPPTLGLEVAGGGSVFPALPRNCPIYQMTAKPGDDTAATSAASMPRSGAQQSTKTGALQLTPAGTGATAYARPRMRSKQPVPGTRQLPIEARLLGTVEVICTVPPADCQGPLTAPREKASVASPSRSVPARLLGGRV